MGVREYDYIRGNTALAPDKKIKETEKQRKKQRKISISKMWNICYSNRRRCDIIEQIVWIKSNMF